MRPGQEHRVTGNPRNNFYSTIKVVIVLYVNELAPRSETLAGTFPAILQRAGKNALFAADEFFSARISNPHTRRAYARPVGRFLAWCEEQGIELRQVTPGLAGRFIEELPGSDPTRNLALAALRHFFDALVTRHAVALNPFASVRGRKHAVVDGKTPELTIGQARALLGSLDLSRVVGLRDRAVLGVLTYTGARVGALARLRCGDLQQQESQRVLRFTEKGGKQREIPVRHDLDEWIDAYLEAGKIDLSQKAAPLFLAADRWGSGLVDRALTAHGVRRRSESQSALPDAAGSGGGRAGAPGFRSLHPCSPGVSPWRGCGGSQRARVGGCVCRRRDVAVQASGDVPVQSVCRTASGGDGLLRNRSVSRQVTGKAHNG